MKKKYVIGICITLAIILIAVIAWIGYQFYVENNKKYEIAQVKDYNYFVLKQKNQYGIIDKQGNIIIEAQYEEVKIPNPEKAVFVCYDKDTTKVLNEKKEELYKEYSNLEPIRLKNIASDLMYEKSILRYEKDGKFGLISLEGKELTKPIYDELESLPYKEGELLAKQNNQYGVINMKGNVLIDFQYEQIAVDGYYTDTNQYQYAGYIVSIKTEQGYRYGYMNHKKELTVKTEYNELARITDIEDNENVYLIGAKNGQFGVNKNGQDLLNNEYQSIRYDTTNQVLVVEKSRKYGIANLEGKVIVPVQYNQIDITGMYMYAEKEEKTIVYDKNGKEVQVDPNIAILKTGNDAYQIKIDSTDGTKYSVIDASGKQIIQEAYNYIEYLQDRYFIVSKENGKLGVIDDQGNIQLEAQYDSIQKVQDTQLIQATMTANKITKVYDKTMKEICQMSNAILEKKDSFVKLYNETEMKYFDEQGKEVTNQQVYPNHKLYASNQNGKWGFVDANGKMVVDYQYDQVTELNQFGFVGVRKQGKWGVMNAEGKQIVEPSYERKENQEPSFIGSYYQVIYNYGESYYTDTK